MFRLAGNVLVVNGYFLEEMCVQFAYTYPFMTKVWESK